MESVTEKLMVKMEAKGDGIYAVGCLNNDIWNKISVQNLFIWTVESFHGDKISIGAYANDANVDLIIKLNDVIVAKSSIVPHQYGIIEYTV